MTGDLPAEPLERRPAAGPESLRWPTLSGQQPTPPTSARPEDLAERLEAIAGRLADGHQQMVGVLDEALSLLMPRTLPRAEPVTVAPSDTALTSQLIKIEPGPPDTDEPLAIPESPMEPCSGGVPSAPRQGRLPWQSNLIAGLIALVILVVAVIIVNVL